MNKLLIVALSASLFSLTAHAQESMANASHILNNNSTLYDKFQQGYANAKGTPYIQEEYTLASISGLTTNYMVKYNAFNDEMEVLLESNKVNYVQKEKGLVVTLKTNTPKTYVCLGYRDDLKKYQLGYFAAAGVIKEGYLLFLREKIGFQEAKPPRSGYERPTPAGFKQPTYTYFVWESAAEQLIELPKTKTGLIKMFPQRNLKEFFKSGTYDLDVAEDLLKVLVYCYE
ncbi:MAG: hypothetical protein ACO3G5_01620 [Flavobacteriaceae bacterium]|jgi:hypothetical protein